MLTNPDFAALRRKIVEEQRKDLIIARLAAEEALRAALANPSAQPDSPEHDVVRIEAEALDEQPEREPDEQAAQSSAQVTLTALPMKVSGFSCERKAIAADHLVPDKVVTDRKRRKRRRRTTQSQATSTQSEAT